MNGYLPSSIPQHGRTREACPTCGIADRTQHTLKQAGQCDGAKRAAREAVAQEAARIRKATVVEAAQ